MDWGQVNNGAKKVLNQHVHFETREKYYRNFVLHQESRRAPRRKCSKNYQKKCFTKGNNKNGLSMTQKETTKCSVYFQAMTKHYRDLVWQLQEKIGTLREWTKKRTNWENESKTSVTVYITHLWESVVNGSKEINKGKCGLGNNRKAL